MGGADVMTTDEKLKLCRELLDEIEDHNWGCGCCADPTANQELESKVSQLLKILRKP